MDVSVPRRRGGRCHGAGAFFDLPAPPPTTTESTVRYSRPADGDAIWDFHVRALRDVGAFGPDLIVIVVGHFGIDRPTAVGRTGKQLQRSL